MASSTVRPSVNQPSSSVCRNEDSGFVSESALGVPPHVGSDGRDIHTSGSSSYSYGFVLSCCFAGSARLSLLWQRPVVTGDFSDDWAPFKVHRKGNPFLRVGVPQDTPRMGRGGLCKKHSLSRLLRVLFSVWGIVTGDYGSPVCSRLAVQPRPPVRFHNLIPLVRLNHNLQWRSRLPQKKKHKPKGAETC